MSTCMGVVRSCSRVRETLLSYQIHVCACNIHMHDIHIYILYACQKYIAAKEIVLDIALKSCEKTLCRCFTLNLCSSPLKNQGSSLGISVWGGGKCSSCDLVKGRGMRGDGNIPLQSHTKYGLKYYCTRRMFVIVAASRACMQNPAKSQF